MFTGTPSTSWWGETALILAARLGHVATCQHLATWLSEVYLPSLRRWWSQCLYILPCFLGNIQSGSLCFPEDCKSCTCPSELHDPFLRYPCELMWRQLTEAMAHHWPMPQKVSILRFANCCLKMAGASRRNWNKESCRTLLQCLSMYHPRCWYRSRWLWCRAP